MNNQLTPATVTEDIMKELIEHDKAINERIVLMRIQVDHLMELDRLLGYKEDITDKDLAEARQRTKDIRDALNKISEVEDTLILKKAKTYSKSPYVFDIPSICGETLDQKQVCLDIIFTTTFKRGINIINTDKFDDVHPTSLKWWIHHVYHTFNKVKVIKRKAERDIVVLLNYTKEEGEQFQRPYDWDWR